MANLPDATGELTTSQPDTLAYTAAHAALVVTVLATGQVLYTHFVLSRGNLCHPRSYLGEELNNWPQDQIGLVLEAANHIAHAHDLPSNEAAQALMTDASDIVPVVLTTHNWPSERAVDFRNGNRLVIRLHGEYHAAWLQDRRGHSVPTKPTIARHFAAAITFARQATHDPAADDPEWYKQLAADLSALFDPDNQTV